MKKILVFFAFAALLVCSCAKTEIQTVETNDEIFFRTIAMQTKVDGKVFPTTETFSVYAWADGTVGTYFMDNVTVAYDAAENGWKPQGATYYWPKNSAVDFISYYPTGLSGITVDKDKITYAGIDVNTLQKDIMYADKAAGFAKNEDLADDGANGYTGVPTVFHHALAKVKFVIELVYNHKAEADGTVYDWAVTVNSLGLSGIYTTGGCVLNLATTPTSGIIPWTKPEDANGYYVWTPSGATADVNGPLAAQAIVPGTDYDAVNEFYVMPQALAAGQQKVTVNMTINTTRNGAAFMNETFTRSADITVPAIAAWEINHAYTYRLKLTPLASNGNGGTPLNPGDTVDPNDPNLSDVIITFDPAVEGWENVGVETVLNI